jgi:tetratricopeptide (TPR) repeat protein
MAGKIFLSRFTPSRTDPEVLAKLFMQREGLLTDAEERIHESAVSGNKHHLLIIGPRGSGKTHFVALMFHKLSGRDELRERLRIAWLAEDETTTSFFKLLLRIYRALGERYPGEFPANVLEPLYTIDEAARVKLLSRSLVEKLTGRTLLVIVENLDELFKGLGEDGQQEWRAFLQENPISATLATSQQLFDGVSRRDSPFYGHFQIEYLKPLSLEEAVLLLRKIAGLNKDEKLSSFLQTATGRNRVRALHHLAGGNQRIYIVLSDFINAESLDELIGPFEKTLDELTPYYQARLSWLSAQQREIVEYVCSRAQPVPVKDIARALFVSHQTTTGQLKELKEKGYVISHPYGREARYELSEPLMRLCVEVKENRRQPIRLIVDFLRIWYSRDQLEERLRLLRPECITESMYVKEAIRCFDSQGTDLRLQAVLHDLESAIAAENKEEIVRLHQELSELRGGVRDWLWVGGGWSLLGRHEEALLAFDRVLALDQENVDAWSNRGAALAHLGRNEEALEACDKALSLDSSRALTWNNRGSILCALSRHVEALAAFRKATTLDSDSALAWNNQAATLEHLGRHEEALAAYDSAIALAADYVLAWTGRSIALGSLGRHEEALAACDKAIAINPDDASPWYKRVEPILSLNRWDEGFTALQDCLRRFPPAASGNAGGTRALIGIVLSSALAQDAWRGRITRLVQVYAEGAALPYLGVGLIHSLALPAARMLSVEALTAWRDVWFEAGAGHDALRISLRIFDVGIRYLQTQDSRVLLDLLSEERQILAEALGINQPVD